MQKGEVTGNREDGRKKGDTDERRGEERRGEKLMSGSFLVKCFLLSLLDIYLSAYIVLCHNSRLKRAQYRIFFTSLSVSLPLLLCMHACTLCL